MPPPTSAMSAWLAAWLDPWSSGAAANDDDAATAWATRRWRPEAGLSLVRPISVYVACKLKKSCMLANKRLGGFA